MRGEKNERQVTFHPINGRGRSSAAQEFRQHRDELEQEIGRIARELEEMRQKIVKAQVRIISVKKIQLYLIVYLFITVAKVAVNVTSVLHP